MGGIQFAPPRLYNYDRGRIADLLVRGGDIAAQGQLRAGDAWANAAQQIGQIASQTIGQVAADKKLKARDAALTQFVESGAWQDPKAALVGSVKILGPEAGPRFAEGLIGVAKIGGTQDPAEAMKALPMVARGLLSAPDSLKPGLYGSVRGLLVNAKLMSPDQLPEQWTPELGPVLQAMAGQQPAEGFTLSPGQTRFGPDGKPIAAAAPEPPKPTAPRVLSPGGVLVDDSGKVIYRAPEAPRQDNEPLVSIIGPDGQSILVPRSQAVGKRPANAREQGRPVVSGDANRIADLDTSLSDLNKLTGTLRGSKSTGTAAKAGAMLPNAVTEFTGWGRDAKAKQATIDRVKQVIGKALEGGVLRKEDEYKYEKILPIISDVPEVVNAKLQGLWSAIQQRRQTMLDALGDAGYDVSKYNARTPPQWVGTKTGGTAPATSKSNKIGRFTVEVE